MKWHDHSKLKIEHSILSPSRCSWLNYDADKMAGYIDKLNAAARGTKIHALAAANIEMGQMLPDENKTLNMYVNDAIHYHMRVEQKLVYSDYCFGTADAICFRGNKLQIHDLKTGVSKAHMEQLEIYAALFCLEYNKKPESLTFELRLYQSDEISCYEPTSEEIRAIMDKIVELDKIASEMFEYENLELSFDDIDTEGDIA